MLFALAQGAWAQDGVVRFSDARLTLREALAQIREQTGCGVAYSGRVLDPESVVETLSTQPVGLGRAMKELGLSYSLAGNVITITRSTKPAEEAVPVVVSAAPVVSAPVAPVAVPLVMPAVEMTVLKAPVEIPVLAAEVSMPVYRPIETYAANHRELPRFALKANLLYGAATLTPNLAFETGIGGRTSLEISGSYNPWNLKGSLEGNRKLVHMIIKPEFRYWFCERYSGHFLGFDAIFARYNIGTRDIPLLFEKEYRYDGTAYGVGITYGYQWMLGRRWGVEVAAGVGVLTMNYDRFDCAACVRNGVACKETYFGPTNAAVNLIFLIK